jgi:hypothetical protein
MFRLARQAHNVAASEPLALPASEVSTGRHSAVTQIRPVLIRKRRPNKSLITPFTSVRPSVSTEVHRDATLIDYGLRVRTFGKWRAEDLVFLFTLRSRSTDAVNPRLAIRKSPDETPPPPPPPSSSSCKCMRSSLWGKD